MVSKFMFVPAHNLTSDDDRVRCDSTVCRLMLYGAGESQLYLCDTRVGKQRSKKKYLQAIIPNTKSTLQV